MTILTKSTYLKGPKGDAGSIGPKGDRGPAGLTGPQGVQGPDADPQYIRGQFSASGNITYNYSTGAIGFADPGYATITYVDTTIANLVNNAPAVLDTIKEIADAINNDPNFYNNKLSVSGGVMTGALLLDADPVSNLQAATKQYVDNATLGVTVYSTDDVPEGTNLYYTEARVDANFSTKTTTALNEGTNLYYTDSRARSAISVVGNLNYNSSTGVISYTEPGRTINDLTDVDTASQEPSDGQTLVWSALSSKWVPGQAVGGGTSTTITTYDFTATTGQTAFSGNDFDDKTLTFTLLDTIQVFKNGILLRRNADYNINDGGYIDYEETDDIISLVAATNLNDWVHIVVTNTSGLVTLVLDGGSFTDTGEVFDCGTY